MHRHFQLWDLILLGIGAMVGTGVFINHRYCSRNSSWSSPSDFNRDFCLVWDYQPSFLQNLLPRVPATGGAYSYLMLFRRIPSLVGWLVNHDGVHGQPYLVWLRVGQLILKGLLFSIWDSPSSGFKWQL